MTNRTKKTVADKTRAFSKAFPPHPQQDEFIAAAIALRAHDSVAASDPPITLKQAFAGARLHAVGLAKLARHIRPQSTDASRRQMPTQQTESRQSYAQLRV